MAQITLNIPDDVVTRVVKALCEANQLPVSNANAKKAVINYVKQTLVRQEIADQEKITSAEINAINASKETAVTNIVASAEAVTIS
jgi:hypothetical protein